MFQVNDYVVYGSHGVCVVRAVGAVSISSADPSRLYYTLEPLYFKGNTVYTPVDNQKAVMREIISKEDAWKLIEKIPEIEVIKLEADKKPEVGYKEIMGRYECKGWAQIVKTLYLRKQGRLKEGRKNIARDDTYLKAAQDFLFGELAVALGLEKDTVESFIVDRMQKQAEMQIQ
ncbi:MAG: CarD family transcriptional regulator [Clostridium sp.]